MWQGTLPWIIGSMSLHPTSLTGSTTQSRQTSTPNIEDVGRIRGASRRVSLLGPFFWVDPLLYWIHLPSERLFWGLISFRLDSSDQSRPQLRTLSSGGDTSRVASAGVAGVGAKMLNGFSCTRNWQEPGTKHNLYQDVANGQHYLGVLH